MRSLARTICQITSVVARLTAAVKTTNHERLLRRFLTTRSVNEEAPGANSEIFLGGVNLAERGCKFSVKKSPE
jgi:hypothetical protein